MEAIRGFFDKNTLLKLIYNIITLALSCLKCTSFYVGWILGGFWCGVISTFITYLYVQLLAPKIDKIRFQ
jgi:hypothetical protein